MESVVIESDAANLASSLINTSTFFSLVRLSKREAVLTVSPIIVNSNRVPLPRQPINLKIEWLQAKL